MLPHLSKVRSASFDGVSRFSRHSCFTVIRFPPKKVRQVGVMRGNVAYVAIYELLVRFLVGGNHWWTLALRDERYGPSVNFMQLSRITRR